MKTYEILQHDQVIGTILARNEADAVSRYKRTFWIPGYFTARLAKP